MKKIRFLTLAEIMLIHNDQIENYGGQHGLRDVNLLSSAVAMPEARFSGNYLHKTIYDKAAAYLFHICQNHAFIDGNKRVALASCLVFLDLNGIEIYDGEGTLYELVINITSGIIHKERIAQILEEKSHPNTGST